MLDEPRPPAALRPPSIQQMVTAAFGQLGTSPAGNPSANGLGIRHRVERF
jgi:hypothetical protein